MYVYGCCHFSQLKWSIIIDIISKNLCNSARIYRTDFWFSPNDSQFFFLFDIIRFSVTCKSTQDISMQSINYRTHVPIIGCCTFSSISYRASIKLCGIVSYIIGLIDPLDIFAEYRRDVLPSKPVVQ